MAELTEVHEGMRGEVHPLDLLREVVPDRALVAVVNALVVGLKKHKVWDSSESRQRYVRSAQNHLTALSEGRTYDEKDHHHHASALVVRGLQILDAECAGGG